MNHVVFDLAGLAAGALAGLWAYLKIFRTSRKHPAEGGYNHYFLTLSLGAIAGAMLIGTANLYISGVPGLGRSIAGSFVGGIAAIEWYKRRHNIKGSTGAVFVIPLALGIAIGRIGCFRAGLADYTYGIETKWPTGFDFGDGILRHPVQLYESASMALFLILFLALIPRHKDFMMRYGFYLFVAWYGGQRFVLEFLKPYETIAGPFNMFHVVTLGLILYAVMMIRRSRDAKA